MVVVVVVVTMAVVEAVRHRRATMPRHHIAVAAAPATVMAMARAARSLRATEDAAPVTAVVPARRRRLRGCCSWGSAQPRLQGVRDGHACAVSVGHLRRAASSSCYRPEVIVPVVQHNDWRRPRTGAACDASLPAPHFGARGASLEPVPRPFPPIRRSAPSGTAPNKYCKDIRSARRSARRLATSGILISGNAPVHQLARQLSRRRHAARGRRQSAG